MARYCWCGHLGFDRSMVLNSDSLASILIFAVVLLGLGLVYGLIDRRHFAPRWLLAGIGLVVVNDTLLTLGHGLIPDLLGGDWNWTGKVLALAATLAIAAHPAFGWRRCGLTLAQNPQGRGLTWGVAAALVGLFIGIAISAPNEPIDTEALAFQLTMPGLEEEPFYRGILLLAFNEAFRRRWRIAGIDLGWGGLLAAVAFGLAHGLDVSGGVPSFDAMSFALTAIPSFALLWLRERTGSLLLPIVLHNFANAIPILI